MDIEVLRRARNSLNEVIPPPGRHIICPGCGEYFGSLAEHPKNGCGVYKDLIGEA